MPEGVLDYDYKSKYPDTPFEKYNKEFEEEMKRPFFYSEDLIELGEELMGFSKKELIDGASQDVPKFFKEGTVRSVFLLCSRFIRNLTLL